MDQSGPGGSGWASSPWSHDMVVEGKDTFGVSSQIQSLCPPQERVGERETLRRNRKQIGSEVFKSRAKRLRVGVRHVLQAWGMPGPPGPSPWPCTAWLWTSSTWSHSTDPLTVGLADLLLLAFLHPVLGNLWDFFSSCCHSCHGAAQTLASSHKILTSLIILFCSANFYRTQVVTEAKFPCHKGNDPFMFARFFPLRQQFTSVKCLPTPRTKVKVLGKLLASSCAANSSLKCHTLKSGRTLQGERPKKLWQKFPRTIFTSLLAKMKEKSFSSARSIALCHRLRVLLHSCYLTKPMLTQFSMTLFWAKFRWDTHDSLGMT